ncbi:putative mscS Mechanosensitive ion channel [Mycobacterium ulcerans str. Harvey]|uniref:MscS Mechanosensitive ion channel n=1 Tax=Mycobacterium ulcerans str. Harvey TaxID=1299332 RepID=A0ABN0RAC1_MYCUL|nr:putative mscS Mechanosensitive ion channel [Mycobacterium ulcerans str. Harvey]
MLEDKWGRIEEIALTYVVVNLWDRDGWSCPPLLHTTHLRTDAQCTELLGTVELDVDFAVGLQAMRAELQRQLAGSELWDQRVGALQVTDAVGGHVRVRILVSAPMPAPCGTCAARSAKAWSTGCSATNRSPTALARCAFRTRCAGQPACRDAGNGANEQDLASRLRDRVFRGRVCGPDTGPCAATSEAKLARRVGATTPSPSLRRCVTDSGGTRKILRRNTKRPPAPARLVPGSTAAEIQ